jgi:hypothetical protein
LSASSRPRGALSVWLLALALLAAGVAGGCAARRAQLRQVQFSAPSAADPEVRPLLADVKRLGVLCSTDIAPSAEVDIEKVLTRLGHAVARQLQARPGITVVTQDEILWQLQSVDLDSTDVIAAASRQALLDSLAVDAMVVVEVQRLQARTTSTTPGPYGLTADPGLDLAVQLRMSLVNLHSRGVWQQAGQERQWKQPARVQQNGANQNQGEQQLLTLLGRPLQRFLQRVAPPPRVQVRDFDLGER